MLRSLKRYRYWILGVGLLSIISVPLWFADPGLHSKFNRIRLGTTQKAAEETLGDPPGDYAKTSYTITVSTDMIAPPWDQTCENVEFPTWAYRGGIVVLAVDAKRDIVVGKKFYHRYWLAEFVRDLFN